MAYKSKETLTISRHFLQPTNTTHRQYEALRAYFVDRLCSVEAARRFGYTPGSFRLLVHQFRKDPRREFFLPSARESRAHGKQNRLREEVVTLRKHNLSIYDISRALAREERSISPAAVAEILRAEGFARLPRRQGDERPAGCALRSLLALKLFGNARHSHVMSHVLDEGLALFAGLNVVPKRSFLTECSCRIDPACYPKLMQAWFDAAGRLGLAGERRSTSTSTLSPSTARTRWSRSTTFPSEVAGQADRPLRESGC